jgi:hypothetical protein
MRIQHVSCDAMLCSLQGLLHVSRLGYFWIRIPPVQAAFSSLSLFPLSTRALLAVTDVLVSPAKCTCKQFTYIIIIISSSSSSNSISYMFQPFLGHHLGKTKCKKCIKPLTTLNQQIHRLFLRYLHCNITLHIPTRLQCARGLLQGIKPKLHRIKPN